MTPPTTGTLTRVNGATQRFTAISDSDVSNASYVFTIGCALPDRIRLSGKADDWSDVPDDRGYAAMRDAIVRHVNELLDRLQRR